MGKEVFFVTKMVEFSAVIEFLEGQLWTVAVTSSSVVFFRILSNGLRKALLSFLHQQFENYLELTFRPYVETLNPITSHQILFNESSESEENHRTGGVRVHSNHHIWLFATKLP